MKEIYSKVNENELLFIVYRGNEITGKRKDISPDKEYLQASAFELKEGVTFKPHKHIVYKKITDICQEAWIILSGKVRATLYDTDDTIIAEPILGVHDMIITFRGGHTYTILEDNTKIYEMKTGPYYGQKFDKVFIEEEI